jgi:hypothetical protein
MHSPACAFCGTTRFICFWGELQPYRRWRRASLFLLSVALVGGIGTLFYFFVSHGDNWILWLVGLPGLLLALLGVFVSLWGCESCVVRLHGDV